MALTYSTYISSLASLLVVDAANADFLAMVPNAIEYTEDRLSRDLNVLNNTAYVSAGSLTPNLNTFTIPAPVVGPFIILENLYIITPAGSAAGSGEYVPLTPVSKDYILSSWPSSTTAAAPRFYAMVNASAVFLGPWPDAAYVVFVAFQTRRAQLSEDVTTNYLTSTYSDMYLAASMVFMAGYLKNYGAQADDPKMALSWEAQYQTLLGPAKQQADRMRSMGSAWSAMAQSPEAQPVRA